MEHSKDWISLPKDLDKQERAEFFRDNDNIGADTSVFVRMLRQLFADGKPIGSLIGLFLRESDDEAYPIGIFTETDKERVVFWPALPAESVASKYPGKPPIDHITIQYPSKKVHWTGYTEDGEDCHGPLGRLTHLPKSETALWFLMAMRIETLRNQDMAIQRKIKAPGSDKDRRVEEFIKTIQGMRRIHLELPISKSNFIACQFYMSEQSTSPEDLKECINRFDLRPEAFTDTWKKGVATDWFGFSSFTLNQRVISIAMATPAGSVSAPIVMGFPRP